MLRKASNVYGHVLNFLQNVSKVDASSQALMVLVADQTFLGYKTIDDPLDPEWDDTEPRMTKIVRLHWAVYFGFKVSYLTSKLGKTVLHVASKYGHQHIDKY